MANKVPSIQEIFATAVHTAETVDVYEATRDCLNFIEPRLGPKSYIMLDDIKRNVKGVERAVEEFLAANPSFLLIPLFPSQGLLLSTKCW